MIHKYPPFVIHFILMVFVVCTSHSTVESQKVSLKPLRHISTRCENCEFMYESMPNQLFSSDTTEGWYEPGQKLIVTGKVYQPDKTTPASDIILYYYHTDQKGHYSPGNHKDAGAQRHGRLRGWVKTGTDGSYSIYTNRPAQYPNNEVEAHIHVVVKEPDIDNPYWIDEWIFDDDPLVKPALRNRPDPEGGSGILKPTLENGIQVAQHDIILGLNISDYPVKK